METDISTQVSDGFYIDETGNRLPVPPIPPVDKSVCAYSGCGLPSKYEITCVNFDPVYLCEAHRILHPHSYPNLECTYQEL